MVEIVFKDFAEAGTGKALEYEFDVVAFIICLIVFAALFEIMMNYCGYKIRKTSVKSIMIE